MADRDLRVLSIFGTRPEGVKMAPVVKRLAITDGVHSEICITAQHRTMLDQVLEIFEIEPTYDLDLMKKDQGLGLLTSRIFKDLEPVLVESKPDWVLIQGDTTTVMAAAVLAHYHRVQVAHVEAGLRTGDKWQPFPEESNRKIVSAVADLHFAPTEWAKENLLQEGINPEIIEVTGNPVIDALMYIKRVPYDLDEGPLASLPSDHRVLLLTAHRRESFGEPLEQIFTAVREIAGLFSEEITIVYPVHMNPNVWEPAHAILGDIPNVRLIEPLDYLAMVHLMDRACLILTDSGGIQEEAPALGTPVLVLREKTERPEALHAGTAQLVGTAHESIVKATQQLLTNQAMHRAMSKATNPFGDGRAAERIVDALQRKG
jgi:UDP-N-acetylglucosamine 2-epimerase (non-hydrolysing)